MTVAPEDLLYRVGGTPPTHPKHPDGAAHLSLQMVSVTEPGVSASAALRPMAGGKSSL